MSDPLTEVHIHFLPDVVNHRLRFGHAVREENLDRRRSLAWFAPGAVFGYIRWENGQYGTTLWRLYVLKAGAPAQAMNAIPGITPGAEILALFVQPKGVKAALEIIDSLESRGFDPAEVSPDYWRHVEIRVFVGREPHRYTDEQHAAWLHRKELML